MLLYRGDGLDKLTRKGSFYGERERKNEEKIRTTERGEGENRKRNEMLRKSNRDFAREFEGMSKGRRGERS